MEHERKAGNGREIVTMNGMIRPESIIALCLSAIVSIGLPVLLLLVWHKKANGAWIDAVVGALIFLVFAMGLEQLLHSVVLKSSIVKKPWAFILYASFAAGIFEETGRFVGFRFLLKKHTRKQDAIMYGIGHGGIESILIAGLPLSITLIASFLVNSGKTVNDTLYKSVQAISTQSAGLLLMGGEERIAAICLHIALSVLVFLSVRKKGTLWMYPLAILFHAAVDSLAAMYRFGVLKIGVLGLEGLIALSTLLICLFSYAFYRREVTASD